MNVFVAYDFHIRGGLDDAIDAVMRKPPPGMALQWTGAPGCRSQGDLWKQVIEPGIRAADAVVAYVDLPNANVGFEIGYALGTGKKVAIARCRSDRPDWLNLAPLNGVLCERAGTAQRLREIVIRHDDWIKAAPVRAEGNRTLFLCPQHAPYTEQRPATWITPSLETWGITDLPLLFQQVGHVVWIVAPHHQGALNRDGDHNAALSVIAGYGAAMDGVRLDVLIHDDARNVADVVIHRRVFRNIDELGTRLREIEVATTSNVVPPAFSLSPSREKDSRTADDNWPNFTRGGAKQREASPAREPFKQAAARRLIYERVPVQGFLAFDDLPNPYEHVRDATDPDHQQPTLFWYLWFPHKQYIQSRSLQDYTPAAILCCLDPRAVIEQLQQRLGEARFRKFSIPPRNLRNEEKCLLLHEMGSVLDDCFEVVATFPKLVLEVGNTKPEIAYDVMVTGFVLPFVQLHQRLGFEHFRVQVSDVGGMNKPLLARVKKVFVGCYGSRHGVEIDLVGSDIVSATMVQMARLFAWTVGTLHNSGNPKWIRLLETAVETRGSSPMEEPR